MSGVVLVGVGQVVQREPGELDAVGLMAAAARAAADDAGAPELLARLDAVLVPEGMWSPGDAGRAVAVALGSPTARTVLARVGVLQTTPIAWAASGRAGVVLVVGGEARASERAGFAAAPLPPGPADEEWAPAADILTAVEIERGLAVPVQSYAVQQSALGTAGLDVLWDGFAEVAATNPHAWDPAPSKADRMVSTPYARRHCSQWNVDMAAALLFCSTAVADAVGVPVERRVHPHAVVESNHMVPVSERARLDRSPAVAAVGRALDPADHVDLYSCFPSAVLIQAAELGIDTRRPLTVTGGMAFAGGPLNSAVLHAVASTADVLRADPGSTGLVTAVSGMLTKHGASTWSTAPPDAGFRFADVSEEARATTDTVEVDPAFRGEAVVDGSTVVHDRGGPALAVVVGTTRAGARVLATGSPERWRPPGDVVAVDGPDLVERF